MSLILSGSDGLSDVDGSAATPAIRGTDANTGMFFPAADTIAFSEGGVESMRIASSGNVSIGTTAAVARLSVTNISTTNSAALDLIGNRNFVVTTYGATSIVAVSDQSRGAHDFGAIRFEQNPTTIDGGGALFRMFVSGNSSSFPSSAEFLRATSLTTSGPDNIALRTQDADRLYITSGGFVGIGTSSPGQRLHVAGVGYFGPLGGEGGEVQLAATGGTVGAVLDVDSSNNLRIINAAPTITLFSVNSIERMRLASTGLLIGTDSANGAIGNNVGLVTGKAMTATGTFISTAGAVWNDVFTITNPGLYILHAYIGGYNSGPTDWSNAWMVSYTGGVNIFVGPSVLGATGNVQARVKPGAETTVQILSQAGAGITYTWATLRIS
jgi:hypothetical protein